MSVYKKELFFTEKKLGLLVINNILLRSVGFLWRNLLQKRMKGCNKHMTKTSNNLEVKRAAKDLGYQV